MSAVREAKNTWIKDKAKEVKRERFGGKKVWQCIRDMLQRKNGLNPTRCVTMKDEAGIPCTSIQAQQEKWRRPLKSAECSKSFQLPVLGLERLQVSLGDPC